MLRFSRLLAGLAIGIAAASLVPAQTIQINRENKTIAISTTDEATATADIAAITIGFEIFGADSLSTYADGGKLSNAILDALHEAGVKDESIESAEQTLQRNGEFTEKDTPEQRAKKQFVFHQSWTVSVPPQVAAGVLRAAIAAGANRSGAIEWRLADRKALQAKAAGNALVKAKEVAARMAEGLNVKLGALIYASNEMPETHLFFKGQLGEGFGMGMGVAGGVFHENLLAPKRLEIFPQTIREEATVYAVFAIE
jgi:uncharacterized protein YggE